MPMPAEIGPPSLTSPILGLADGRLAMSIETNKPYLDRSKWKAAGGVISSPTIGRPDVVGATDGRRGSDRPHFQLGPRRAVCPRCRSPCLPGPMTADQSDLDIHRRASAPMVG